MRLSLIALCALVLAAGGAVGFACSGLVDAGVSNSHLLEAVRPVCAYAPEPTQDYTAAGSHLGIERSIKKFTVSLARMPLVSHEHFQSYRSCR